MPPTPAPEITARPSAATRGPVDPRLLRRTRVTRRYLLAAVAVGTALAALVVGQAWVLSQAIGGVVDARSTAPAVAALPALGAVVAGRALLSWVSAVLAARAAAQVKSELRAEVVAARLSRPDSRVGTADLAVAVTSGLDALDGYFGRYLPQLVLAGTVPLVVGVAIWSADWVSALVVAVTLPLVPLFMALVGWLTQAVLGRRARVQARLAHHFADLVAGLPTLQAFGRARAQAEGLRRTGDAHRRETMAGLRFSFLSALVLELVATLSVAVVAVGIGLRLVEGHLSLTTALFVLLLAPEAYLPLRLVGSHYHDSTDGLAAVEQAFAVVDAAERGSVAGCDLPELPDLRSSTVELSGVGVTDPTTGAVRLAPLDLVLGPGEVVALTGPSGCGKSTAVAVLLGLVAPTTGRLTVAGRWGFAADPDDDLLPLAAVRDAWLARLAWVPQSPALLAGSVAENVLLGAPGAPRSRVRAALARAGAADLDLDAELQAGSEGLSAGQLRRVALARALLRVDCGGGELLVLDEPTAGLDADVELAAIRGVRGLDVGALVVSHRPAVLAAADRVVRLP